MDVQAGSKCAHSRVPQHAHRKCPELLAEVGGVNAENTMTEVVVPHHSHSLSWTVSQGAGSPAEPLDSPQTLRSLRGKH